MLEVINMGVKMYTINEDYRMKIINFLKIYGYYDGVLSKIDIEKKYVSGELKLSDIIQERQDFKKLKMSVKVVLDYATNNYFDEIYNIMKHFYKVECLEIRKKYGNLFDRL